MNGRAVDVAGDELTPVEIAEILSDLTGREIVHYQVPLDQVRSSSEEFAAVLEWFDEVGYDVDIEGNAAEFDIAPTPFEEWARQQD